MYSVDVLEQGARSAIALSADPVYRALGPRAADENAGSL